MIEVNYKNKLARQRGLIKYKNETARQESFCVFVCDWGEKVVDASVTLLMPIYDAYLICPSRPLHAHRAQRHNGYAAYAQWA
jgi:hypothetical protein